jgi:hypothetical protein
LAPQATFRAVQVSSGLTQGLERNVLSPFAQREDMMAGDFTTDATDIPGNDRPHLGRTIRSVGTSLGAVAALVGGAVRMAYVDPFSTARCKGQDCANEDADGRDPAW